MKSITITLLLLLLTNGLFSQQRPPFSEKTVEVKDRIFLPYTKGEVVRKINGPQKPVSDEICSIITAWDSITPPQGLKVACYGFDNSLEIYFSPYLFEEGIRYASESSTKLSIYVNDPLHMFGSPIAPDIFLCPQKTADFNGFPIYQTGYQEVTIVHKKKIPLFVPVSREEYLNALIAKEEKNTPKDLNSDYQATLLEMEQAYQKLLKTDKESAIEFKQQMDNFKSEINKNREGTKVFDLVESLRKELSGLTAEERTRQAYYSGSWAMEEYHNASGLVPAENEEKADALVRPNPALIDYSSKEKIQLLVLCWSVGENNSLIDKPRLYNEGRDGFHLADDLMSKLYKSPEIWNDIFNICN